MDEELPTMRSRRGQQVIKTTVEMNRDLYLRIKEEVVRNNTSIREFLTKAASTRLETGEEKGTKTPENMNILIDALRKNAFAKKVLGSIEKELTPPFGMAIFLSKAEEYGIPVRDLRPGLMSEEFIKGLCEPVDHLSGKAAAIRVEKELKTLRGE